MFLMRNLGGPRWISAVIKSCISRHSCALRLSQNSNFRLYRDLAAQFGKPDETPWVISSNLRSETKRRKVIIELRRRRNFQYFPCFLGFWQCFGTVLRLFSTRKWCFGAWISENFRLRRSKCFNSTMVEAPHVICEFCFSLRSRIV